jgi:hypothetical protein
MSHEGQTLDYESPALTAELQAPSSCYSDTYDVVGIQD